MHTAECNFSSVTSHHKWMKSCASVNGFAHIKHRWKPHLDRLSLHALYFSAASNSSENPDESVVGTGGARVGFF